MDIKTLTNGLRDQDKVKSLYIDPPTKFNEIMDRTKVPTLTNKFLYLLGDEVPLISFGIKFNKKNKPR